MKHKTSGTRELGLNKKGQEVGKDKHLNNPDQKAAELQSGCGGNMFHLQGVGGAGHRFLVPTFVRKKNQTEVQMQYYQAKELGHQVTQDPNICGPSLPQTPYLFTLLI